MTVLERNKELRSYLASQPTCIRQPKCHVQHIILIILRLRQHIIVLRRHNDVTRRTRNGPLTRTLEVDVVLVRDGEDVVALVGFDGFYKNIL